MKTTDQMLTDAIHAKLDLELEVAQLKVTIEKQLKLIEEQNKQLEFYTKLTEK